MSDIKKPISVVCLTGHRDIPQKHVLLLPSLIEQHLTDLIARGACEVRAGGALGFDMVATLKVLELRERYPQLRLSLCLPCRDQADGWLPSWQRAYRYILDRADAVHYEYERYAKGCMLARNRRLVEGSDVCLAYCTRNRGGSFYTCSYALQRGLELINLADGLPEKA